MVAVKGNTFLHGDYSVLSRHFREACCLHLKDSQRKFFN